MLILSIRKAEKKVTIIKKIMVYKGGYKLGAFGSNSGWSEGHCSLCAASYLSWKVPQQVESFLPVLAESICFPDSKYRLWDV